MPSQAARGAARGDVAPVPAAGARWASHMDRPNFYAGLAQFAGFDRAAEHRRDPAWISQRLAHPGARFLALWQSRNLVAEGPSPGPVFLASEDLVTLEGAAFEERAAFLGEDRTGPYFALELSRIDEDKIGRLIDGRGRFVDLRVVGALMEHRDASLLAYARGLLLWHARHLFCGTCGTPTRSEAAGHVRVCTGPACGAQHFPRTDPAVIVLVTYADRCLLARQAHWPPGMHATLAGFVEPGESLEDAVQREMREEAGVELGEIRYHSSQPWPFPSSIMLGFTAQALGPELKIDASELESGGWFSRDFVRSPQDPNIFRLSRVDSIAYRLIQDWLDSG